MDPDGDDLTFSLESAADHPTAVKLLDGTEFFRIDARTGVIYLAKTLEGQARKRLQIFVTVTDGQVKSKVECQIIVLGSDGSEPPHTRINNGPPGFPQLPPFFQNPPVFPVAPSVPRQTTDTTESISEDVASKTTTSVEQIPQSVQQNQTVIFVQKEDKDGERKTYDFIVLSIVIPITLIAVIPILVTILYWYLRKRRRYTSAKKMTPKKSESNLGVLMTTKEEIMKSEQLDETKESISNKLDRQISNRYELWAMGEIDSGWRNTEPPDDKWEFPRTHLKMLGILGEGCFGQVWKFEAKNFLGKEEPTIVAVKTLKEVASAKERSELLKELEVMKLLEPHQNVVSLLGCCTEKDPVLVILEYVSGGKLQTYLRKSRAEHYYGNLHGTSSHLTSQDLMSFGLQIANGMEYLSSKGIVHRDLAARNVLIEDDTKICKVADFGFARDLEDNRIYEKKSADGRLPIRWLAPESLYDNIYTSKSDVWSFGVLLWEIVTLGSTPYPGLAAGEVMNRVRDGYRLEKPDHCRREVYNLMFYCWDSNPDGRPAFSELVERFEELLSADVDYIELERFPDHSYYNVVQSEASEKI
ncbi:hypothetical protein QYM36_000287 [Artemia franciscana]|uniref:receptor protein-tyrosine kinase n=2 Tax=Artemia franciscana TaxID=6661 RepID=A0AA88LCV4_ARTSF|nr:hypothetical protein QYM36_000287 [Artemia franciscana]